MTMQLYEFVLTICFYCLFHVFFKMQFKGTSPWTQFIQEHNSQLRIIGVIWMAVMFINALMHESGMGGKAYNIAVTLYAVRHFSEVGLRAYIGRLKCQ